MNKWITRQWIVLSVSGRAIYKKAARFGRLTARRQAVPSGLDSPSGAARPATRSMLVASAMEDDR
jgi:hypothetical protein